MVVGPLVDLGQPWLLLLLLLLLVVAFGLVVAAVWQSGLPYGLYDVVFQYSLGVGYLSLEMVAVTCMLD